MQRATMAIVAWLGVFMPLGPVCAQSLRMMPHPGPPPLSESECKVTPVDAAHLFIVAGVMEGDTLTNLQLEDPTSRSTVVRVRVKPGLRRLTVLLQSNTPVIWDFEGATQRVQRAIIVSGNRDRRVALRGLPSERAEFPELARCRQQVFPPWAVSVEQRDQALATYFGRSADRVVFAETKPNLLTLSDAEFAATPKGTQRSVGIVRMPGGIEPETFISKIKRTFDELKRIRQESNAHELETFNEMKARILKEKCNNIDAERDLFTYHPGGFREIEAGSLVSPVPVLAPETFPGEAGLIQLERAGAIRSACRAEIDAFVEGASQPYRTKLSPDYRVYVRIDYVVTREIMLPPSLHGAHTKEFLVLNGVPAPRGNAGHGCVYGMTGFTVSEPRCSGSGQYAIEFLQSVDLSADLTACRLLEPSPEAAIEAVAIYDPSSRKRPGEGAAAPVVVRVEKPGDVFLVLNDLGPVVWRIQPAGDTRIVGVLLTGHYTSSVEGIASATPMVSIDHASRERRPKPDPICAPFLNYIDAAYIGGPHAMALDAQVKAFTGRRLDGFRGGYGLKDVEIR